MQSHKCQWHLGSGSWTCMNSLRCTNHGGVVPHSIDLWLFSVLACTFLGFFVWDKMGTWEVDLRVAMMLDSLLMWLLGRKLKSHSITSCVLKRRTWTLMTMVSLQDMLKQRACEVNWGFQEEMAIGMTHQGAVTVALLHWGCCLMLFVQLMLMCYSDIFLHFLGNMTPLDFLHSRLETSDRCWKSRAED